MYNCSWEQIKNIIINREAIMSFYQAAKNIYPTTETDSEDPDKEEDQQQYELKQKKIKFLGECVYECLQRLQYHANMPITEELIRNKTLEFLDILRIPGFTPTKKWFNLFKATYNITLSNRQISIYNKPQSSLDIKDIIAYCTREKSTKTIVNTYQKQDVQNGEYEAKRLRKLNFLQEALKEYLLRVKCHHKSMKLDAVSLRQVAREFNEILKVQDFDPTLEWIDNFRNSHDSEEFLANGKKPPLSLDLKDILSYCSRMQNKTKDNTVTLAPKETALQMRVLPKYPAQTLGDLGLKFHKKPIIYLDEPEAAEQERDIKPDIEEIRVESPHLEQTPPLKRNIKSEVEHTSPVEPPPLKIRKIESINNDPELQRNFQTSKEIAKTPAINITQLPKEPVKLPTKPVIYIQKCHVPKENLVRLPQPQTEIQIKKEKPENNHYMLHNNTIILPTRSSATPPIPTSHLRIQHVQHHITPSSSQTTQPSIREQQTSTPKSQDPQDTEELPRHVTCFKDVLLLLKPLEEYAMLKENYRAIGLITQLEEVLKNPPEETPAGEDEEFIG